MPTFRQPHLRTAIAALFVPLMFGAAAAQAVATTQHKAVPAVHAAATKTNAAFNVWADKFAADWVRLSPELATATQYFSGAEQDALDRQLDPITDAQRQKVRAMARAGLARLDKWMAGPLDEEQLVSAAVMRWSLARVVEGAPFEDHLFVFNQMWGLHTTLVSFMTQTHPLRRASDVDSYLARLDQVATRIDEGIARARSAASRNLIPPRFILERSQDQVNTFLKPEAAQNVFVASLEKRTENLPGLSPQARAEALAQATRIVQQKILPAYGRVKDFMAEIYPATGNVAGVSRLPNGAAAYAFAVENYTSTKLGAEEIHAIGLREVTRIEAEMDKHLRSLGYTEGSVKERMVKLDASLQPKTGDDPRPQLLARYTEIVKDAQERSKAVFNLMPRAAVEVKREPPLTEPAAAAHYTMPAPDGTIPGIFWVPLRGPTFEMMRARSLSYHEAVQGHHFQLAIQQEQTSLPKYRAARIFSGGSAHAEGWALYAERLAMEQGWYEGDVPGLLGALDQQLFRARRLVVDTGIHAKGWTREQGIDYGISKEEVERYVAWPGQANAYMIGQLRILELREKAKAALGAKFSLPAFHDLVLRTGSVPLDVLGDVVDRWIEKQKKS
jgi:uncharacterized protein (DUF885 family)